MNMIGLGAELFDISVFNGICDPNDEEEQIPFILKKFEHLRAYFESVDDFEEIKNYLENHYCY